MEINGKDIDINTFRENWAIALMARGMVVKIKISRWRAQSSLTYDKLGLKFHDEKSSDFASKYLRLGSKKLLPPEILREVDRIELDAKANLSMYSYDTVWGRFVPYTAFNEWHKTNEECKTKFYEAAKELVNKYDDIIKMVKADYRNLAIDVWQRLYPDAGGSPTESYIQNFIDGIIREIPSKEDIMGSFKYVVTYLSIPLPSFMQDEVSKADLIKRENDGKNFASDLEKTIKSQIANEYLKKKGELIDSFLDATVKEMRFNIAELCESVIASMKSSGENKINLKHVDKIRNIVKKVRMLNFQDDREIVNHINSIERELLQYKGDINPNTIANKLNDIVIMGKKDLGVESFCEFAKYIEI